MKTISCLLLVVLASCLVGSTLFANPQQEPKEPTNSMETKPVDRADLLQTVSNRRGCNPANPVATDLSGYYIGTIKVPQLSDAVYKAKLHIDKGEFTLVSMDEADLKVTGTLSAVKTCDYTGAAFRVLDAEGGIQNFGLIEGRTLSVKATPGKVLSLTDVAGQSVDVSFYCDCSKCKTPKKCDCCGG